MASTIGALGKLVGFTSLMLAFLGLLACAAPSTGLASANPGLEFELNTHDQAGWAEQDVFVWADEAGAVRRVPPADARLSSVASQPLYAAAEPVAPDPFALSAHPLGPFPMGLDLGMTLDAWLAASGSGVYHIAADGAVLELSLHDLVPGGLYSVWCSQVRRSPRHALVDRPCGATDGSENVFTADDMGQAEFEVALAPLPASRDAVSTVLRVAYHSDGQRPGARPSQLGHTTHVQLVYEMPPPERR